MTSRTTPLETIANRFLARREELAEEMTERICAGVAEFAGFDGPELWEAVRVSCLANLEAGLASMAHDLALPEAIPADARDLALLTARLDLPLAALLRSYRVGHAMTWQLWLDEVEREDPEAEVRRETLVAASDYLFEYVDRLATFLTDEYTAERDRFMRSREQRRTQLVRDILDGADPQPGTALGELDYDLRLEHLGCVVSGPDAEIAVRALARELDAARQLVVSLTSETSWAWVGRVRPFRIPERISVPEGDDAVNRRSGHPAQRVFAARTVRRGTPPGRGPRPRRGSNPLRRCRTRVARRRRRSAFRRNSRRIRRVRPNSLAAEVRNG
jgi:hypothetical protein